MLCIIDFILLHQFVVQIAITKDLNVDSRLVSKSAPTYFPNRVFSFRCWIGSKLGFLRLLYICIYITFLLAVACAGSWSSCSPWACSWGSTRLSQLSSYSLSWFLEFQIVTVSLLLTVAWFTGFKTVTVALFSSIQLVTFVFLLAVARFLYIIQAFVPSCLIPLSLSLLTSHALALVQIMVNSTPF